MRAISVPLAVTALAAALVLTACGDDGDSSKGDKSDKAAGCQYAVKVGPANAAPKAGDTGNVPVTLTNRDTGKCTLEGFPGIELSGGSTSWAVGEVKAAKPEKVTLQPKEQATFTITYVRGKAGAEDSAAAKRLKITIPAGGTAQSYAWSYGDVALKDEKTPNASVGPFQIAGD